MNISNYIDATILKPEATQDEFKQLCQDAIQHQFPTICVPPYMVLDCKEWLENSQVKVATVVGFPAGYQGMDVKLYEIASCIEDEVDEIDYVIHRGYLADKNWEEIGDELESFVNISRGSSIISKWIIECSTLQYDDIDELIKIANKHKPDYVKTSTGVYGKANLEQVKYLRKHLSPDIKIKAAGGIADRETAIQYIEAGADRIGVSSYKSMIL